MAHRNSGRNTTGIACLAFCMALAGCGGGGGGDDSGSGGGTGGGGTGGGGTGGGGTGGGTSGLLPAGITASKMMDVDGDLDIDIIIGPQDTESADVMLLNDGDGTFTKLDGAFPDHYLGADGTTVNFESADFDEDGNLDIIATTVEAASYSTAQIHLYLGNGDGTFEDATTNVSDSSLDGWPDWIRVADFDNDGHTDFLLTVPGCTTDETCFGGRIYLNDGAAGFAPATITSTDAERSYSDMRLLWENDGNTQAGQGSDRIASDVLVADLNLDGTVDLFAPNAGTAGPNVAFLNVSTPGNLAFDIVYSLDPNDVFSTQSFKNGALIDVNGDGYLDIIGSMSISFTQDATEAVHAFINQGDASFIPDNSIFASSQPAVEHARQWLVSDFDLNGSSDLFVADHGYDRDPYPGEKNLLLLNDGAGALNDVTVASLSGNNSFTHGASVGDVNGDGYADLFLNNPEGDADGRLWLNNGDGTFRETSIIVD